MRLNVLLFISKPYLIKLATGIDANSLTNLHMQSNVALYSLSVTEFLLISRLFLLFSLLISSFSHNTPYSFFTALAHIILFFIKMFLILILIPLVFTFIFLVILLTLSILWFKYGFIFFGIFIGLIGTILINYIFINLLIP